MKPVLVLQHQTPENLAYLATWLKRHHIPYVTYNAETHKQFPDSIESYSALAVMGGAMSSNDSLYTNRQAEILILQAMYRDIPVIGHCLGGQLMSRALGGTVTPSIKPEIGWQPISYIDHELTTQWFGTSPSPKVIHWHYEMFSVPTGATLLATSAACPHQAFAIGKHLAMQFHIEIDELKVNAWVDDPDQGWMRSRRLYDTAHKRDQILEDTKPNLATHQAMADHIYANWLKTTCWQEFLQTAK